MKYAARIFLIFLVLYTISEVSYKATAGSLSKQETRNQVPYEYLIGLDYSEVRLEGGARLQFESDEARIELSQYIDISSADTAGMTRNEFEKYLSVYQLPEELVSVGLTNMKIKSFERHKAVISVEYETAETRRYQYWCIAADGIIQVYDSKKEMLILEQPFIRTRFTPLERRQLELGMYIGDYGELTALLATE